MQNSENKMIIIFNIAKSKKNVFEYCPRVYIEGGYYEPLPGMTAGVIRLRLLIKGGPCMSQYEEILYIE